MDKRTLIIILIAAIIAGLFLVGSVFFKKEPKEGGALSLRGDKKGVHQIVPEKPQPEKLSEEEIIKTLAENFASSYYSYTWGEFGMMEGLYYFMTEEMVEKEKMKVEQIKKAIQNQPRQYFTARAEVLSSDFIEHQKNKASLNIDLEIKEFDGAMVERDTIVLVDANGDIYGGDSGDLVRKIFNKSVKVNLIKIGEKWRVDGIGN